MKDPNPVCSYRRGRLREPGWQSGKQEHDLANIYIVLDSETFTFGIEERTKILIE
ncbi:hypothetical protein [Ottowia thiooxydans]|uniref:hypothetical protein n=1 Tax=Ottowia thiooxydans TaxID=219182 RepID=UPI0012EC7379|nr:hypothetical protein [Ottowia thiooxydans]